jgi:hypothetical protein
MKRLKTRDFRDNSAHRKKQSNTARLQNVTPHVCPPQAHNLLSIPAVALVVWIATAFF